MRLFPSEAASRKQKVQPWTWAPRCPRWGCRSRPVEEARCGVAGSEAKGLIEHDNKVAMLLPVKSTTWPWLDGAGE